MYARDRELALQFYREDIADEELYTRPAPIELLAATLRQLVGRLGQWLIARAGEAQPQGAPDAERLAP